MGQYGITTIGVFRAPNSFFLRNSNTSGNADYNISASFVQSGDVPVVGDWDGDGVTTIGVYRSPGFWFLRNTNTSGSYDITFSFGSAGDKPLVGRWQ